MTPSLSLRPEGEGTDVRLLFHHQPTGSARLLSGTIVHAAAALALLLVSQLIPDKFYEAVLPQRLPDKLVFLAQPGPGGGGGGNTSPEPPPPAQLKGPDQITVPMLTPPEPTVQPVDIAPPPEPVAIAAQPMAGANQVTLGVPLGTGPSGPSQGPGDRGVGTEKGDRPGIDGGPHQPGNGVVPPRLRRKVDPQYSADAMRAKIQGLVVVSAVVLPDGSVTDVRVIRSLDRSFGLDLKAIEAARQWRFFPGTRQGEPVPVLVNIELEFNLR
jgi:periplasmic protein TonB